MRIDSSGIVTKPLHPAFRAKITSEVSNVTGDGTEYTLNKSIWSEIYDQGSNFNPSTGTFTAPVTGKYTFTCNLALSGVSPTTHDNAVFELVASNRVTTFYASPEDNYNASLGGASYTVTTDVDMDASDTLYVYLYVSGGSKTIDIWVSTTLTGHLIC